MFATTAANTHVTISIFKLAMVHHHMHYDKAFYSFIPFWEQPLYRLAHTKDFFFVGVDMHFCEMLLLRVHVGRRLEILKKRHCLTYFHLKF